MSPEFKLWLSRSDSMSVELQVFQAKLDKKVRAFVAVMNDSLSITNTFSSITLTLLVKFYRHLSRFFIKLSSFSVNFHDISSIFHHISLIIHDFYSFFIVSSHYVAAESLDLM